MYIFFTTIIFACFQAHAQIESEKIQNTAAAVEQDARAKKENSMEIAVSQLSKSMFLLGEKLGNLENNLHLRFQVLEDSISKEKISIENISTRLDMLDQLSAKVKELDSKVEEETTIIRRTLRVTNKDVQRISTKLEVLEERGNRQQNGAEKIQIKKDVGQIQPSHEAAPDEALRHSHHHHHQSGDESGKDIGVMLLEKMEGVLPRLIATQLNHFYLNLATKMDHTVNQLQRELVMRLRRIEATTKKGLSEIQDGRQDISHLSHLQRTVISKQSVSKGYGSSPSISKCEEELKEELSELLHKVHENVTKSLTEAVRSISPAYVASPAHVTEDRQHRDKGGIVTQPSLNSPLWRQVFGPAVSGQSGSPIATKQCLDQSASATLEEVKQLLRSLMTKGEDIRRTLTKQAGEGVDLLKLLHQRFSVLLRRMNTDPGHGEALLAEVQELEHLVENSYSSILLAQNVFIESCRRIQEHQPSIEGQIVDILNKLVTNIDLGHQFNRKQLREVRKLIEKMNLDEQGKISLLPPWLTANDTSTNDDHSIVPFMTPLDRVFQTMVLSASEVNITEDKLQGVIKRIHDVESELQAISWSSGNVKNIIDELLTGAKDLKGYSRQQIEALQSFRAEILEFADSIILEKRFSEENSTFTPGKLNGERDKSNILDSCLDNVVKEVNISVLSQLVNNLSQNTTGQEIAQQLLKHIIRNKSEGKLNNNVRMSSEPSLPQLRILPESSTTSTINSNFFDEKFNQDENQMYYDLDQEEMLMDDDLTWNPNNNYYNDDLYEIDPKIRKRYTDGSLPIISPSEQSDQTSNKATIVEEDFESN